jgi:hypothetical protein
LVANAAAAHRDQDFGVLVAQPPGGIQHMLLKQPGFFPLAQVGQRAGQVANCYQGVGVLAYPGGPLQPSDCTFTSRVQNPVRTSAWSSAISTRIAPGPALGAGPSVSSAGG